MIRRRFGLVALPLMASVAALGSARAQEVDLSPERWPAGELERYSQAQRTIAGEQPPAVGHAGLVVGTSDALAVRAGVEALRQGGTAADAALTTALAQTTLGAGAVVSFAGKLTLVYFQAESQRVHFLNGGWLVPRAQASGDDIPPCDVADGRQVLVPGFMSALEAAHDRFGVLPFRQLFAPAIYFAREGFEIHPLLDAWIRIRLSVLTSTPAGRQIFVKPDGSRYRTGDWFRQKKLARTLGKVSRRGARHMYEGRWGRKMVSAVRGAGGVMERADLEGYEPLWQRPETFGFDGFRLHTPAPPATGGKRLRTSFDGLDAAALRDAGHYSTSPDSLARMLAAVERRHDVPSAAGSHSAAVVAVDRAGNVAALLHTINTDLWGGTGLFVDGVSIADVGCWASRGVTEAGPGGRLATGENPTLGLKGGRPILASSSIGAGLFDVTFFSLVNLIAYGMDPQQAVDTPTFQGSTLGEDGRVLHRALNGDFSAGLLTEMENRGYQIRTIAPGEGFRGQWIALTIDPGTGERRGATTGLLNGAALAE